MSRKAAKAAKEKNDDYMIVESEEADDLESQVWSMIDLGYEPVGGVSVVPNPSYSAGNNSRPFVFFQAVIGPNRPDRSPDPLDVDDEELARKGIN